MHPKVTPAFTKAYAQLNEFQKKAVDTITGPVMVLAGPGTGKTQVLALRIGHILKETDTKPDEILALTFTEAGVYAMRSRLVSLIGTAAYHVHIHTFHGFCNSLIQEYPHQFERLIGSTQIADIDSVTTLREVIDALPLKKLKKFGDPYFFVTDIRSALSELKREAITPDELARRITEERERILHDPESIHTKGAHKGKMKAALTDRLDSLERSAELALVYRAYSAALQKKRLYDFDDMILETIAALKENKDFLQLVQEKHLYILADEHQDANTAQNTILTLLTAYDSNPNLFLVGDDKQAIFSFQGASLAHFRGFKNTYPHATEITLTDSYRSGTAILDASHALMARSGEHADRNPQLTSRHSEPHLAKIVKNVYSTEEVERASVVARIQALLAEGVPAEEIAIIYRNNKDAAAFSRALHNEGILHSVVSNQDVLKEHVIAQFVGLLVTLVQWGDEVALTRTLHAPFMRVPEYDVYRLLMTAKRTGMGVFELFTHDTQSVMPHSEALAQCREVVSALAKDVHTMDARSFFDRAVRESGFLTYILGRNDAHDVLASVRGLGEAIHTLAASRNTHADYTIADVVHDLSLYREYNLRIEKDETLVAARGVQLMTAHKSKGLEFSYVFVVHVRDKKWGNVRSQQHFVVPGLEKKGDNEDERRLLYVAITRAKLLATLSLGLRGEGDAHFLPSLFLTELDGVVIEGAVDAEERAYAPEHIFHAVAPASVPLFDTAFLRQQFLEQGLSATAINNYLTCPWKFFYRNLVRIPERMQPAALFGNAIHEALHEYFSHYAHDDAQPALSVLIAAFERELPKQGFFKKEREEALERGTEALTGWYAHFGILEGSLLGTEMHFDVPTTVGGATGSIVLHGIFDRLTITPSDELVVTDFKTGTPKTRGEVAGTTKHSDGNYKRQLEFYSLLLHEGRNQRLAYGQIEFVEADKKGGYKREVFAADELDTTALKNTIIRICEEIYTFSFWGSTCGDKECEYCTLRAQKGNS